MKLENTKTQMRRGILEYCILSIISRGEVYPSDIIQEMTAAQLLVKEGTLYPLLNRLKNANLLSYRWEESSSGPPRKYYSLTDDGLNFLSELKATWNKLVQAVEKSTQSKTIKTLNHE